MLDTTGEPHIMDFGLAKREAGEITMTVEGAILGTPAYMSPEQARGEVYRVDGRTDVYSLGVLLFEMLTGERPFRGDVQMLLKQVVEDEPPSLRKLDGRIPRDLETICLKCLEKDRDQRYVTADQLSEELRRQLQGKPIFARPIGRTARTWRWCRRNPLAAGLIATVFAVLLLGVIVSTSFAIVANWNAHRFSRANTQLETTVDELDTKKGELEDAALHTKRQLANSAVMVSRMALREGDVQRANDWLDKAPLEPVNLRHWEWYYLRRQIDEGLFALFGHTSGIESVAWSPIGDVVATGSADKTVRIWDARSGKHLHTFRGHRKAVTSVHFSHDGEHLISAGDRVPRIWSVDAGTLFSELPEHESDVNCARLAPDGTHVATACNNDAVSVWDRDGAERILYEQGRSDSNSVSVPTVAFHPDGNRIAVAATGFTPLRIWDLSTGKQTLQISTSSWTVAYSADGTRLATADYSVIHIWDAGTGSLQRKITGHPAVNGTVVHLAFSPDGMHIASASVDGTARLWEVETGKPLRLLPGHADGVNAVDFSPDGAFLVSGSNDRTARIWSAERTEPCAVIPFDGDDVYIGPRARHVGVAQDNDVAVWDVLKQKRLCSIGAHTRRVWDVAFSENGKLFATASDDQSARVWDIETGKRLSGLRDKGAQVHSVAINPNGTRVATADRGGKLQVWNSSEAELLFEQSSAKPLVICVKISQDGNWLATGDEAGRVILRRAQTWAVDFSRDGSILSTSSSDGTVVRWNALTGEPFDERSRFAKEELNGVVGFALNPHGEIYSVARGDGEVSFREANRGSTIWLNDGTVLSVDISPDGSALATGTRIGVKVWSAEDGQPVCVLRADERVSSPVFSPDGKLIATVLGGDRVRLWDAQKGVPMRILDGHEGDVSFLTFSRDGTKLLTGAYDRRAVLWDLESGEPLCEFVGHDHAVYRGAISPDGSRVVTGSGDPVARVWDAHTGNPVAELGGHQRWVRRVILSGWQEHSH